MWLWILSAVFLILVWAAWWFLLPVEGAPGGEIFPTWVAITITAVVVLALVGLVVYRRIRAARAARALEKAIAQQAQEQVLEAKPEDRPEVQALQKQMLDGMKALKASRLGEGDKNPLYSMPWYAIVGPPGAGKTTALRHSGLSFPYLDSTGGGVRGVGGTKNCDWWFTNDAILLDTAGRYTTESDDHDEWMAFLHMLRDHRKHKPLNGVLVAVAISDLIDATEDEIEQVATRVRERIDEMQRELKMVLPIYVLFTKCDLVAGFVEYFGDLKRSERGQAWGATLPLSLDKSQPSQIFDQEFDLLVQQLHKRSVKRMASPRASRAEKERIYQFPLEFAAIKRNLSDFIGSAFEPAAPPAGKKARHVPTPMLRGFYFTSGTQEGRPLDRVVGAMGRAFGLRAAEPETTQTGESKSYFLKEVFTGVVFPDHDIAGRTEDEIRRVRWQRIGIAAAACVLALLLMVPAVFSYGRNQALIAQTKQVSDETGHIDWTTGPVAPKIDRLDALRAHLEQLDQWKEEGPPVNMRWGMYQGDRLFDPALQQYIAALESGFIFPVKKQLEGKLAAVTGEKYLDDYNDLKTYLLLTREGELPSDPHLQTYDQWEIGRLTQEWAEFLRGEQSAGELGERELRNKLVTHVSFYVDMMKRGVVSAPERNGSLVASARNTLQGSGSDKYYDQFVTILEDQKIDEAGPNTVDNLKYPPITLNELFADRPDALRILSSKRKRREGQWKTVRGPYTLAGHKQVLESLENFNDIIEREKWVVPLSVDEREAKDSIELARQRVRQDYDQRYITEWVEFFRDIDVAIPQNNVESIDEFKVLSTPIWPYQRLLQVLKENTQFPKPKKEEEEAASGVADQIKRRVEQKIDSKTRTPGASQILRQLGADANGERIDPVPEKFASMVEFAFPPAAKEGENPPPGALNDYIGQLEQLASSMQIIEEGPAGADPSEPTKLFTQAVQDTEKRLLSLDRTGQELMRDLLMNPLRASYEAMLKSAGGAASGLWEVEVYPPYADTIKDRYPFNVASRRDASFEDAVAFFKPGDGVIWGFYDTYLKGYHRQVGHKFVPASHLQGSPRPARPFTPFNPNLYNCLERAHEISDALFSKGGEAGVTFKVNLTTVSPVVSEIIFELDGKKLIYKNEKQFWHTVKWPGDEALAGASIRIKGAGGLNEEIRRDGPWGLWRLLEAGRTSAAKSDDRTFVVEWDMAGPPVTVQMEMKPTRANHPFSRDFFRNLNCPASIGDFFGPGG